MFRPVPRIYGPVSSTLFLSVALGMSMCHLGAVPIITHVTEPACHNEVIVITGEQLDPAATKVKALYLGDESGSFDHRRAQDPALFLGSVGSPPPLPGTPPANALDCRVVGGGDRYLHVVMQCSRLPWTRVPAASALWVGREGAWGEPVVVNRPRAQWIHPRRQAPGEVVRVFGRTFSWGYQLPSAQAFIRRIGTSALTPLRPAAQHREDGHTERWSLAAWLPKDAKPGEYEILLHGRHGGPHGWSDPLRFTIATAKQLAGPVVDLKEMGAVGDGLSDDTDAFELGLAQAAGGTLLIPPGAYALSRTVSIPERVTVRGAGMHQSLICNLERDAQPGMATGTAYSFDEALLKGMGQFTLRDLTVRFMPATGSALWIGKDREFVEDVTLYRIRLETRMDYGLSKAHAYTTKPLTLYSCRRFRMIHCETYGPAGVFCARKVEECEISQNVFRTDRRWRSSAFKFWGAENCIFEDNIMEGDVRGLVMQTHFGVNFRNFIAGNTVLRASLGGNAGETYLVEGAGQLCESRVELADAASVSLRGWPLVRDRPAAPEDCIGRFVVVARGPGFGQWRRIVAADPPQKRLHLARRWKVVPDADSTVVVMNGLIETVFVNNQEVDSAKGLYLYYAGAINNIIDRHVSERSLGLTIMTRDDRQEGDPAEHDTTPDLFNLIRDCRIHDGGGIVVGAGGRLPLADAPFAPVANFGNRIIANEILRTKPFSGAQYGSNWRWGGGWSNLLAGISLIPMDLGQSAGEGIAGPARIVGNVVQDNLVGETRFGVGISKRAAGTLLYRNTMQWVPVPVVDHGLATRDEDTTIRGDEAYTPEKGPIR